MNQINQALVEQQKKVDEIERAASTNRGNNIPEGVAPVRAPPEIVNLNASEEASQLALPNGDNVSISGSNRWFGSIDGRRPSSSEGGSFSQEGTSTPRNGASSEKEDVPVVKGSQEFWQQAATKGYEDKSKACGQEISSSLACAAKVFWQKPMVTETLKEKIENAALPANCSFLVPKRTDAEIWSNLPSFTRSADVKLQEIQKTHAAATTMVLRAA